MTILMPAWDGTKESAEWAHNAINAVVDVLVNADMWTGEPPYQGKSPAEQVQMLVRRAEAAEAKLSAATEAAAVAALTSGEFQTKLVAAQKQLAQVGQYARYYHGVESKKALFPRDTAALSFTEWYAKGEE